MSRLSLIHVSRRRTLREPFPAAHDHKARVKAQDHDKVDIETRWARYVSDKTPKDRDDNCPKAIGENKACVGCGQVVGAKPVANEGEAHRIYSRNGSAKQEEDGIFLVTDAMATAGSEMTEFALNGRKVQRAGGRLMLEDGTLAGADLDLGSAVRTLVNYVNVPPTMALRMATTTPAKQLRVPGAFGRFVVGEPANAIHLDDRFAYLGLV